MVSTGYPLVLTRLENRRCVVVGGGRVAERKVAALNAAGATPVVVSPTLTPALARRGLEGKLSHRRRAYRPGDLVGATLAFAATDDPDTNRRVAADADALGVLVNVTDAPEAGGFHTVATVRRGDLLLTVSTAGASPTLAARIARELEARYGPEYAVLVDLLGRLRAGPARRLPPGARRCLWRALTSERVLAALRRGRQATVGRYTRHLTTTLSLSKTERGHSGCPTHDPSDPPPSDPPLAHRGSSRSSAPAPAAPT